MKKVWISILVIFMLNAGKLKPQSPVFSPEAMKADMEYLNKYMKKWHPAYYQYTSETEMDSYLNLVKASCDSNLNLTQFKSRLRWFISKTGCGHIQVLNPETYKPAFVTELLPLEVWVLGRQLFVRENNSGDKFPSRGDEILSINNIPSDSIINAASEMIFTDGYNRTYKTRSLELNFKVWYYITFGNTSVFMIQYKTKDGTIAIARINALPQNVLPVTKKIPPADSTQLVLKGNGIGLYTLDFDTSSMLIDLDNFSGAGQGKTYKKIFRHLRKKAVKNLVIDLRDNGGGNAFRGNYFLSYLMDPLVRGINISRKPNLTSVNPRFKGSFWEKATPVLFTLNPLQYPWSDGWHHYFPFVKKMRNSFHGRVFVFTNGGTFSMASYTTTMLKHKAGAVVIGEETGGGEAGSRGMATGEIVLPNSGIRVSINVYQIHNILNFSDKGTGVMPDFPVKYTIQDRLLQNDLEMEKVKSLIINHH